MPTSNAASKEAPFYDVAPAHEAQTVQAAATQEPAQSASNQAVQLRGEEFDFDPRTSIEPESEAEAAPGKSDFIRNGALWLILALALLYGVYTLGAVIGEKSRKPLAVGPFVAQSGQPILIKVDVGGAVNRPGVYDLPFNARVQDAIRKAGGPKTGANLGALNLAEWAQDGAKIEVPTREKPAPAATPTIIIKEVPVAAAPSDDAPARDSRVADAPAKTAGGIPFAKTESGGTSSNASVEYLQAHPVDLNKATQAELEVLPGVGPKMAERILAYRAENGGFKSVDELDEVKGIGEKRMATLKPLVKVR